MKKVLKPQFVIPVAIAYVLVAILVAGPWFALFTGGLGALVAAFALWLSTDRTRQHLGVGLAVVGVALCGSGYLVGANPAWLHRGDAVAEAVPSDPASGAVTTQSADSPTPDAASSSAPNSPASSAPASSAASTPAGSSAVSTPAQSSAPAAPTTRTTQYVPPPKPRPTSIRTSAAPTGQASTPPGASSAPTTSTTTTSHPTATSQPTLGPTVVVPSDLPTPPTSVPTDPPTELPTLPTLGPTDGSTDTSQPGSDS